MNTIRIEVEVPEGITVTDPDTLDPERFQVLRFRDEGRLLFMPQGGGWLDSVGRQIAAAVEARKPRPPKFGVGDVVEYVTYPMSGTVTAVHAPKDGSSPAYFLNGQGYSVFEDALKLVRRAAK